jgi:hypothetical protein
MKLKKQLNDALMISGRVMPQSAPQTLRNNLVIKKDLTN